MKRFLVLYLLTMFIVLSLSAQEVDWLWAQKAGGSSVDNAQSIAVDSEGNMYVAGSFSGTVAFGSTSLTGGGSFVAKLDTNGNWLWAQKGGGTGYVIAVDAEGNSYVNGSFKGTSTFGTTVLTNNGWADIFVSKLDTDGNWLWAKQAGGTADDYGYAIAVDAYGNSYVTGEFRSTATFGDTSLTSSSAYSDIFVAKMDPDGNWLWAEQAGGSYFNDEGHGIAVDSAGNSYVTGRIFDTATFGTFTLNGRGNDIFIAKVGPNGKWLWANLAGWVGDDFGQSIAVDSEGNSYVTGHFVDTAKFDNITLTSSGNYDSFIAKADKNGKWLWAYKAGGSDYDQGNGVTVDDKGNSYVTGYFYGVAAFGSTTLTSSSSSSDIFVAKMDTNGNWLWAKQAGGIGIDQGWSIAVDTYGNSYVTGHFSETATFGNSTLTSSGSYDIFVAKINTPIYSIFFPNGGEELIAGDSQTVRWYFNIKSMVDVKLSPDAGYSWVNLTSSPIDSDLGQFTFNVPYVNSDECLIKVESVDDSNIYAISENCFSITYTASSTIIIDTENLTLLRADYEYDIKWTAENVETVNIDYSYDVGYTWNRIASSLPADTETYSWVVPKTPSNHCYIRIEDTDNQSVYNINEKRFTICSLDVLEPVEDAIWATGLKKDIKWSANHIGDHVKTEYSINNGANWTLIADNVQSSNSPYEWTIPDHFSNECRVRITSVENDHIDAVSDLFTIRPQVILNSPNGGEDLLVQSVFKIEWDRTIEVAEVIIDYSIDGGDNWTPVHHNPISATVGYYNWIIPNTPSDDCWVKVIRADDTRFYDISDAPFSIVDHPIEPQYAEIEVEPKFKLDFDVVYLGFKSESQKIWLKNIGNIDLIVDELSLLSDNSPFSLSDVELPLNIPAEDSLSFGVVFTPQIAGTVTDSLYIQSNSRDNSTYTLILQGEGKYAPPTNLVANVVEEAIGLNWEYKELTEDSPRNLIGYNIYRNELKLNEDLVPETFYLDKDVQNGSRYIYYVTAVYDNGESEASNSVEVYFVSIDEEFHLPLKTELHCNYPNPFNPDTKLSFNLAEPGFVKIDVYNLHGQFIKTLTNAYYSSGRYTIVWDGSDSSNKQVGSGIYFYRMKTKDYIKTRRMSLIK
ncbi:MAG: SBBP repeat-containing protein [Candidatus Cloacimonadia bacterium]